MQFNSAGKLQHLLAIEGLDANFVRHLLQQAEDFYHQVKLESGPLDLLKGKVIANLFFEPSTRTRCSFELAAKRLGAEVINMDIARSSVQKGETLFDTVCNLAAMGMNAFVIRHHEEGAIMRIAQHFQGIVPVVNAGDGQNEHPTQALLDMLTISHYKKNFSDLRVAIIGDIRHSRVAHSDILALQLLGVKQIRLIGPKMLMPIDLPRECELFHELESGLKACDVIIVLRIQRERLEKDLVIHANDYFQEFGITSARLRWAKSDAIVMHPGPINREVELSSEVADGPQSVILQQVKLGVPTRMAVLANLLEPS